MANQGIIEIQDLTKSFKTITAIDHLSLQIGSGEVFGLVGPDGAGKSTLLRILVGVLHPTEGGARVDGHDMLRHAQAIRQSIGYMAQGFALYADLTVAENMAFFADVYGVRRSDRRQRMERLLSFARLEQFQDRRAGNLSGGMQKKLGLACTLLHNPRILFLDEPTTGVDPISRREFWDILLGLHVQGITIVISTPYMDEAERCSRVGLMYGGRMIVCDTPSRIKAGIGGEVIELLSSDPSLARSIVSRLPFVLEVQTYGKLLHVFVRDAATEGDLVVQAVEGEGIEIRHMRRINPRMEEAFISLVTGRARAGGVDVDA